MKTESGRFAVAFLKAPFAYYASLGITVLRVIGSCSDATTVALALAVTGDAVARFQHRAFQRHMTK
jgi:hypothetical protein